MRTSRMKPTPAPRNSPRSFRGRVGAPAKKRRAAVLPSPFDEQPILLTAAGVGPAVAAGVAAPRPYHAAAAAGALDRVLPRVEESRLTGRRGVDRDRLRARGRRVLGGQAGLHLGGEDADFLLLLDG